MIQQLILEKLKDKLDNSYSPYSKFKVSSALKISGSDDLIYGVNVENVSFGATICAERSALVQWISQREDKQALIEVVYVMADSSPLVKPCGMCLQMLSEFCSTNTQVVCSDVHFKTKEFSWDELFPQPFSSESLKV